MNFLKIPLENMTSVEQTIKSIFNSKREELFEKYCSNGSINITQDQFNQLYSLSDDDIASMLPSPSRSKLKRPQSGYFLFLNSNRSSITDTLNQERKDDWIKEHGESNMENSPWELSGKDKVTEVTRRAGKMWKELMSDEEKQPYLDKAAINKQEWEMKKQNTSSIEEVTEKPKKRRGRPPGSKNKKKKSVDSDSSNTSTPSPPPPNNSLDEEDDDAPIEVSKYLYKGDTYLLDKKSGDVYDISTQDVIGKLVNGEVVFN